MITSSVKLNGSGGRSKKGATPPPKTAPQVSAAVVQTALRQRFNPLRGITPAILSSQLDQFHLGYVAYAALTWEAIERRDDVLKGVAAKRRKAVARLKRESIARDDSPDAKLHVEALDEFYDHLSVVNATDENERGGFSLLVRQMMDAVGKYYAVHEIVWQPGGSSQLSTLNSQPSDFLTAELRFTPLWFFENTTGRLRFLSLPLGGSEGTALEDGGWMITKGDGLMEACSVAYMFKNLPLKDWLSYSDKFGTPGVLGRTNAAEDSDAGRSMAAAVAAFGQNWSGTVYGDDGAIKEPLSLITAAGGAGTLPFQPLIERMDRAMASLWRGSDLSTMSADTKGASVQDGEGDLLLADDAEMISDTLNHYLDRWVIRQKFGTEPLAYSKLIVPDRENVEMDIKIDTLLLQAGAQLGERERMEHYGRPMIDPKDTPLHGPAAVSERITDATKGQPAAGTLANERPPQGDGPAMGRLLATSRHVFPAAISKDMQPLRMAFARCLQGDDAGLMERAQALLAKLHDPAFVTALIQSDGSSEALYQILSAATATGLSTNQNPSK